jgi:hypothetical protein
MILMLAALQPARASSRPTQFIVPDGRWWLKASFDEKYGFLLGEEGCYLKKVLRGSLYVNEPGIYANFGENNFYTKIDGEVQKNKILLDAPVTSAIRRALRYHKKPSRNNSIEGVRGYLPGTGDSFEWASLDSDARRGYVYGYVTCKYVYLSYRPKLSVREMERRVSSVYGLTNKYARDDYSPVPNRSAAHRKINDVIDAM